MDRVKPEFIVFSIRRTWNCCVVFLLRKVEQRPTFEKLQKTEKLISIKKEMDATGYTIKELKQFEKELMERAAAADTMSASYKKEIAKIKKIELMHARMEVNVAASDSYQKSEEKLQEIIVQTKLFYSPDEQIELDRIFTVWGEFNKLNAAFFASRYEGGTIQPLIYSSTLEQGINARIAELESELAYMKETIMPHDNVNL
ncbi:MAG: DUF1311 domain-containing protein [Woeseiaceae bacterium]